MVDLVQWLGEQLDKDTAMLTDPYNASSWHTRQCESVPDVLYPDREPGACDCGVPAALLREIDAKRKTIDDCNAIIVGWHHEESREFARDVLRNLAAPYAGRPGYREDWRP